MSWSTFDNAAAGSDQVEAYLAALDALHGFHDALASAAPGADALDQLADDLRHWTHALSPMAIPELDRLSGRIRSLPVRATLRSRPSTSTPPTPTTSRAR